MSGAIPGDPRLGTITKRHPMAWHSPITFRQAADHVIQFGIYRGKRIDDIARSDKGLLWLAWIYDERTKAAETL